LAFYSIEVFKYRDIREVLESSEKESMEMLNIKYSAFPTGQWRDTDTISERNWPYTMEKSVSGRFF
jgi:hypothetical protein